MNIRDEKVRDELVKILQDAELPVTVQQATIAGEIVVFENVGAPKGKVTRITPDGRVGSYN